MIAYAVTFVVGVALGLALAGMYVASGKAAGKLYVEVDTTKTVHHMHLVEHRHEHRVIQPTRWDPFTDGTTSVVQRQIQGTARPSNDYEGSVSL